MPVIAIDSPSNLNSMTGKKVRTLPMMLKFNFEYRMITVGSPAINNGLPVPYFKACLEICKLCYLEKRIIEYYPLSLRKDDDSKSIVNRAKFLDAVAKTITKGVLNKYYQPKG